VRPRPIAYHFFQATFDWGSQRLGSVNWFYVIRVPNRVRFQSTHFWAWRNPGFTSGSTGLDEAWRMGAGRIAFLAVPSNTGAARSLNDLPAVEIPRRRAGVRTINTADTVAYYADSG